MERKVVSRTGEGAPGGGAMYALVMNKRSWARLKDDICIFSKFEVLHCCRHQCKTTELVIFEMLCVKHGSICLSNDLHLACCKSPHSISGLQLACCESPPYISDLHLLACCKSLTCTVGCVSKGQ